MPFHFGSECCAFRLQGLRFTQSRVKCFVLSSADKNVHAHGGIAKPFFDVLKRT
jgi:hypothetical protein